VSRLLSAVIDRPCPAGDPVPGRGGPERQQASATGRDWSQRYTLDTHRAGGQGSATGHQRSLGFEDRSQRPDMTARRQRGRAGAADGRAAAVNPGHWRCTDMQLGDRVERLCRATGMAEGPLQRRGQPRRLLGDVASHTLRGIGSSSALPGGPRILQSLIVRLPG
jgi:hypothetical protein